MIKKFLKKYREIISYVFFGALTTVVNLICFRIFDLILGQEKYLVTNVISWTAAVIFAYITNKLWVFESKSRNSKVIIREIVSFFGARLFSLAVEEAGLWLMIDVGKMGLSEFRIIGMDIDGNMIAKLIMQVVVVILNYVFSKFIIFAKKRDNRSR